MPELNLHQDPATLPLLEPRTPAWMVFGVNALVFVVEAGYLYWVIRGRWELESFLLLHLGVVLLMSVWVFVCVRTLHTYLTPMVNLLFVAALGPLGALGNAYSALIHAWFLRDKKPLESLFTVLFPDEFGNRSAKLYAQLTRLDPDVEIEEGVAPLQHVMEFGSREQKQAALVLMGEQFVAPFTPILKRIENDPDPKLAQLAQSVMRAVIARFEEEGRELAQDLRFGLGEESILEKAVHFDQHAWSGLLPLAEAQRCRDDALAFYQRFLQFHPRDTTVIKEIGRLHLRSGNVVEAERWFDTHRDQATHSPFLLAWYLEVLFVRRRYAELRALVNQMPGSFWTCLPHPVTEAIHLWSKPKEQAS